MNETEPILKLTDSLKVLLQEIAEQFQGHDRRRLMPQTVAALGRGGQRLAERELGWHRDLVRKGQREVEHVMICVDALRLRGRRTTESRSPKLLRDFQAIVDSQS